MRTLVGAGSNRVIMLYDKNPVYPHYLHLPYSQEPWKTLYVLQRLLTTLILVPVWAIKYSLLPRHFRPRKSWNLRQVIYVNFTRRIFKVTEVAGVTWGTKDPSQTPNEDSMKETEFMWVEPLKPEWRTGVLKDGVKDINGVERVPFVRVGCYSWPKPEEFRRENTDIESGIEEERNGNDVKLVGVFLHGGGYCHMSAHESSRTSQIPRGLIKRNIFHKVFSVEYRLLQHASFPGVVMDAAAVYSHVVEHYSALIALKKCKTILVGDSSGGNLVLALARWIRDEGHLPMPNGLLLLSPSSDPSHNLPETLSSYIPRPNEESDYLVDTPESRALLQRTFLGFKHNLYHQRCRHRHHHHCCCRNPIQENDVNDAEEARRLMEIVHSEYVSPCSPIVLQRWGHDAKQDPEAEGQKVFLSRILTRADAESWDDGWCGLLRNRMGKGDQAAQSGFTESQICVEPPQHEGEAAMTKDGLCVVLPPTLERNLNPTITSTYPTGNIIPSDSISGTLTTFLVSTSAEPSRAGSPSLSAACTPTSCDASTPYPTLFSHFPRSHITIGTAERLTREVSSLACAMEKDGVDVSVHWARDACHDILIVPSGWWDRQVVEEVWESVSEWAREFLELQSS